MSKKFRIIATSDIHGYVLPIRYSDNTKEELGLAKISSLFNKYRDDNTIFIDNGDLIQGSPLAFYLHNNYSGVNKITEIVSMMNYDYFNLGNHDFNFGVDVLKKHIENVDGTFLTCNVEIDGKMVADSYHIHNFANGAKIALFGVVTQFVNKWEDKKTLKHLKIADAFAVAKKTVKKIREKEKVDAIVCVYHGGFEKDLETGIPTEKLIGENVGYQICQELEVDILISGHQHRSLFGKCCDTIISQTNQAAREVALIEFDCDKKIGKSELIKPVFVADSKIVEYIKPFEEKFQLWLDKPLGVADIDLLVKDKFEARLHKHPVVSFINQVQLAKSGADFSAVALFNDSVGFNKEITMRDIVSTYVYSNTLCVLEMNGYTLKEFLEKCAEYFSLVDNEIVVSERFVYPKLCHYNYDMVDGLDYIIDVSKPIGKRVVSIKKNDQELELEKKYTLAMSNYRAAGGGEFDMLENAILIKEIQEDMIEILANYILDHPKLHVQHQNNIKVIGYEEAEI